MSETPEQVMRWFQAAIQKLSPAAAGALSLRKSPCIRKNCPACGQWREPFQLRLVWPA